MPHSVALAIARAASEPAMSLQPTDWRPAPSKPPASDRAPYRMSSLPDLADDSSDSDSCSSDDEEAGPSSGRSAAGRHSSNMGGAAATAAAVPNAAAAVIQAKGTPAGGGKAPPQPLLWMRCKCHWQVGLPDHPEVLQIFKSQRLRCTNVSLQHGSCSCGTRFVLHLRIASPQSTGPQLGMSSWEISWRRGTSPWMPRP